MNLTAPIKFKVGKLFAILRYGRLGILQTLGYEYKRHDIVQEE